MKRERTMIIQCSACQARYQIDPSESAKTLVRVECPKCAHIFEVVLTETPRGEPPSPDAPDAKVLVVDDSKFFRELILDVLKPLPLNFLLAADGNEALESIRRERPSLVILDLNLPGKNGYDLIREVRADDSLKGVRLLVMSGVFRKEADATEARHAGADDFLNKSFKPEQLQQRVTKLLQK